MIATGASHEGFEISPRFRETIEARIARLEHDADRDEALRMRKSLNRCHPCHPKPLIAIE